MRRTRNYELIRYGVLLLIFVYVILLFIFTGGSTRNFTQVSASMQLMIDSKNMEEQNDHEIKRFLGLNTEEYDGVMYYRAKFSMQADELLVVKVKDSGQTSEVEAAIKDRLASRANDFDGYLPDQYQYVMNAQVLVRGNYVFMGVGSMADEYLKLFITSL